MPDFETVRETFALSPLTICLTASEIEEAVQEFIYWHTREWRCL